MQRKNTNSNRGERVASKVQTICAQILRDKFGDDELIRGVSLVGAAASGGIQFVRLFYYSRGGKSDAVQHRLDEITRMVRFELAARMDQKYVPDIRFEYDDTMERAARIEDLLKGIENA